MCRRRATDPLFDFNVQKSGYFFEMYVEILSHFISIIPLIITKFLSRSNFLASLFEFLALALISLFYFFNDEKKVISMYALNIYLILNTVTLYIVSYLVLKSYFYKHHYLSFLINSICILIVIIIDIIKIIQSDIEEYQYYIFVILRIIRIILFCFGDCYSKIALYSAFLSPYSLLLYKAIYETFFL